MIRSMVIALALCLPCVATAQSSSDDRVQALEAENRRLQQEVQALKKRLQELEGGASPSAPKATEDIGADPWGNPAAARRTIGEALRANLQAKGVAVPDQQADGKAWTTYRREIERWWQDMVRQRRFRQSIVWNIEILEATVSSNTQIREYDIVAHTLNDAGARVGKWFTIRCPASAVPNLDPTRATGTWTLKAELMPEVRVSDDATPGASPGTFHARDTIAPQVECELRFSVQSLEPKPSSGVAPSKGGKAR